MTDSNSAMATESADTQYFEPGEAFTRLNDYAEGCQDTTVSTKQVKFVMDEKAPMLHLEGNGQFLLKKYALNRLQKLYGMSPSYFAKVDHQYRTDLLNYHLDNDTGELLLKMDHRQRIRSVLAPDENNISSSELFKSLQEQNLFDGMHIVNFKATQDTLDMRIVFKETCFVFDGDNDPIYSGFYVRNSEIDPRKFDMGYMTWQLVCSNGAVNTFAETPSFATGFKSFNVLEFKNRIKPGLEYLKSIQLTFKESLEELQVTTWSDMAKWNDTLSRMARVKGLPGAFIKRIQIAFAEAPPENAYKLWSAITNMSQHLSDNTRHQFDTIAGRMLLHGMGVLTP